MDMLAKCPPCKYWLSVQIPTNSHTLTRIHNKIPIWVGTCVFIKQLLITIINRCKTIHQNYKHSL